MSVKSSRRTEWFSPRKLLLLLGVAVLVALSSLSNVAGRAESQQAKAEVIAEASKGQFFRGDYFMRKDPGLWLSYRFSVSELSRLIDTGEIASIGLLAAEKGSSNYLRNRPEILITTKSGDLGHVPDNDAELIAQELVLPKVNTIHVTRVNALPTWGSVLWQVIPGLLNGAFTLFLVLMLVGGQFAPMLRMFRPVRNVKTRFADVVGAQEAKAALKDITDFMTSPAHYTAVGATPSRGVLLSGPPGTGKTMLAKALAGECGVPFIACSGSDFTSMYFGMGVSKVKRLFKTARRLKSCILFIDEIDGLGKRTDSAQGPSSTEFNRILNQFLVEIDGFSDDHRVIVIGATNLVDNIEPALIRDGRFDQRIQLGLPSVTERAELFRQYAQKLTMSDEIAYDKLARMTFSLSPASIAKVVNQAGILAARARSKVVRMSHLAEALDAAHMGEASGIKMNAAERRRTAIHEAGHAILVVEGGTGRLEKVSVLPRGRALGVTMASNDEDLHLLTQEDLQHRIEMLLGGRAAEEVILGTMSVGAHDDLKRATEIATAMFAKFGFGQGLAVLSEDQLKSAAVLEWVNQYLEARYAAAKHILQSRIEILEQLSKLLERDETIDGQCVVDWLAPYKLAA